MKYFFSLLALLCCSVSAVQAQKIYAEQNLITDINSAVDKELALKSAPVNNYGGKFLNAKIGMATSIDDNGVYILEATGNSVSGHPTYRVKNKGNNLYIRHEAFRNTEDDWDTSDADWVAGNGGVMHRYTSNQSEAFTCTVLHPQNVTDEDAMADKEKQRYAVDPNTSVDETAWILADVEDQPGTSWKVAYIGSYGSAFMSCYTDTNQWLLYTVAEVSPKEQLDGRLQNSGYVPQYYVEGTDPGCVVKEKLDALKAAHKACTDAADDITLEDADKLFNAFKAALDDANNSIIMPQAGKYYFILGDRGYPAAAHPIAGNKTATTPGYTFPTIDNVSANDSEYFWTLEDAGDGKFFVKNYLTGCYWGVAWGDITQEAGTGINALKWETDKAKAVPYLFEFNTKAQKDGNPYAGGFTLSGNGRILHDAGDGRIVNYGNGSSSMESWKLQEVSAEMINKIANDVIEARLKEKLTEVYNAALDSKFKGIVMEDTNESIMNDDFNSGKIAINNGKWTSNSIADNDGTGLIALNDNNTESYYHSSWGSPAPPAEPHYVGVEFDKAYQTLEFKFLARQNNKNNKPETVAIYGSNDGESWTLEGYYHNDFTIVADRDDIGLISVKMSQAYKYVRYTVLKATPLNQIKGGGPTWAAAELAIYDGTGYVSENQDLSYYYLAPEATRTEFENQLQLAGEALNGGTPTEKLLNDLEAAYNELLKVIPDVTLLTNTLANAKAKVAALSFGDKIGYYSADAKNAFDSKMATVEEGIREQMSREDIDAGVAEVNEALAAVLASLRYPEVNGIYALRCGTTMDANKAVANAFAYATGNAADANILQMRQIANPDFDEEAGESASNPAKIDAVNPAEDTRYLWMVTALDKEAGTISLRNMANGYYAAIPENPGDAMSNVKDEVSMNFAINVPGSWWMDNGKGNYANFSGSNEKLISWNAPDSNCNFIFEEIDETDLETEAQAMVAVTVGANKYQIVTLPFSTAIIQEYGGTYYNVAGVNAENKIVLTSIEDEVVIPAGTPFVVIPDEEAAASHEISFLMYVDDAPATVQDLAAVEFAAEAVEAENLVGTIAGMTLHTLPATGAVMINKAGEPTLISGSDAFAGVAIPGNSGYFAPAATMESGDAYIQLSANPLTGIGEVVVNNANAASVYTLTGVKVGSKLENLPAGIYVVGGKKVLKK